MSHDDDTDNIQEDNYDWHEFYTSLTAPLKDHIHGSFYIYKESKASTPSNSTFNFNPSTLTLTYNNKKYMHVQTVNTSYSFLLVYYIEVTNSENKNAAVVVNFNDCQFYAGVVYDNEKKAVVPVQFYDLLKDTMS